MPKAVASPATVAAALSVLAAFLWATYYFFVYAITPSVAPSATLVYPFLFGGIAYSLWAIVRGHARDFARLWVTASGWLRVGLMLSMQLVVLASTYAAGAVDTALLTLVGDVVLTPVLLIAVFREGTERTRSIAFLLGVLLSTVGASLTILGGGSAEPIRGWAWAVAFLVPVLVALYFLVTARASTRIPTSAVVAQTMLGAALIGFPIAGGIPGGYAGLWISAPVSLGLLVALGVTSFFVAPVLYFEAIERAGLMLPALLMATIPVFTLGLAVVLLGTIPPPLALVGIPTAVLGAVLSLRGKHAPWTPQYGSAPVEGDAPPHPADHS